MFLSIFQVRDDGANGTHGFAMVLSVIDLNEDPSDLSWFSQGLHLPWFRLFTWLYCVATNFVTSQPLNLLSSYPLILSTSQPLNLICLLYMALLRCHQFIIPFSVFQVQRDGSDAFFELVMASL